MFCKAPLRLGTTYTLQSEPKIHLRGLSELENTAIHLSLDSLKMSGLHNELNYGNHLRRKWFGG